MKAKSAIGSGFITPDVFGQNPFEYKGEMYFFNPAVVSMEKVLEFFNEEKSKNIDFPQGFKKYLTEQPKDKPVIVAHVYKVFDDPFLGGVPEDAPEAKKINEYFTEMNDVKFHREYWEKLIKPSFEPIATVATGVNHLDDIELGDFLFLFATHFFADELFVKKEVSSHYKKAEFFKKIYEELGEFASQFLATELPTDRNYTYFLIWEH